MILIKGNITNKDFLKMTYNELHRSAEFGFGRAIIFMQSCKNKEDYAEVVNYLITHDTAYNSQFYGTQSLYCYDLINCFENKERFLRLTIKTFEKHTKDIGLFLKLCELLSDFARDGIMIAKETLYQKMDILIKFLRKKYLTKLNAPEWKQLAWLCTCLLQVDGLKALRFTSAKLAQFLNDNKTNCTEIDIMVLL